ncbi:MAG: hypothetical protein HPY54_13890 [Chthonomonadetes bacterium]|nr:hypothetical protein [Chthonomonadetes bacterium]
MGVLYPDTHPRMENLQVQMWRQASPARKMHMLAQLNATVRTLALAGLRSRYPDAGEAELCRRLADQLWGKEIAVRVDGGAKVLIEPLEVTFRVADVFERLGIPYLVGGSLASILYGMVRSTQGVDIVAEMRPEHIPPFVSALQEEFLVDEQMVREAVQNYSSFNMVSTVRGCSKWAFSSRARVRLHSLSWLAHRGRRLQWEVGRSVSDLPPPRMLFSPSWSGIARAVRC